MATEPEQRYRLEVRATLIRTDDRGGYTGPNDRFELCEHFDLGPMTFTDIAGVLRNIHTLSASIREARSG